MQDVQVKLHEEHGIQLDPEAVNELLYADDTLLVGTDRQTVEKQLACIVQLGSAYGLEMNWQKVELMTARCDGAIDGPTGSAIKRKESIVYLGASICSDGGTDAELARRLGLAEAEFRKLSQVWAHAGLSPKEKYEIYDACVLSRLLYGLHVIWLRQVARRKLDGFHARCVRKILKISPSYYSRISNADVLEQLRAPTLSAMLLDRQLGYFGTLARRPNSCPVRRLVFEDDLSLKCFAGTRRRGRPKAEWAAELYKHVRQMCGTHADFCTCVANAVAWRKRIREFVGSSERRSGS